MFINDKLIYIELEKTGCTHILELFKVFFGGATISKHNRLIEHDDSRTVIGSIRNPWDWYLSLWAYGCLGKGREYAMLSTWQWDKILKGRQQIAIPRRRWKRLYSDYENVEAFREWISLLINSSSRKDIHEGYSDHPLAESIGLMTYRYLRMYLSPLSESLPTDRKELLQVMHERTRVDGFIRLESLEEDFIKLTTQKLNKQWSDQEKKEIYLRRSNPLNASQKLQKQLYFDEATINLIAEKEWLIVQEFDYQYQIG